MHLRYARKDIRFAMPFATCPNCKAKQPNCLACKGRGWLTERSSQQGTRRDLPKAELSACHMLLKQ